MILLTYLIKFLNKNNYLILIFYHHLIKKKQTKIIRGRPSKTCRTGFAPEDPLFIFIFFNEQFTEFISIELKWLVHSGF